MYVRMDGYMDVCSVNIFPPPHYNNPPLLVEASSYSSSTLSSKSTITISGDFTLSERAHSLAAFTALHCPLLTASTTGRESGSESVLTPSQIDQLVVATGLSGYSHRVKASVGGGDEAKGESSVLERIE